MSCISYFTNRLLDKTKYKIGKKNIDNKLNEIDPLSTEFSNLIQSLSTINDNNKTFWNKRYKKLSKKLLFPNDKNTKELISLKNNTKGWHTNKVYHLKKRDLSKKAYKQFSEMINKYVNNEIIRLNERFYDHKKEKFEPNEYEKNKIKFWFDASRKIYNTSIAKYDEINDEYKQEKKEICLMIKEDKIRYWNEYVNKYIPLNEYIERLLKYIPEWAKKIPEYMIINTINEHYCQKMNNEDIYYKSHKNTQSIFISNEIKKGNYRLIKDKNDEYWLYKPNDYEFEEGRLGIIALDPGERTFQTYYNEYICGEWGNGDRDRLYKIGKRIDKTEHAKELRTKKKKRIRTQAIQKRVNKIKN